MNEIKGPFITLHTVNGKEVDVNLLGIGFLEDFEPNCTSICFGDRFLVVRESRAEIRAKVIEAFD